MRPRTPRSVGRRLLLAALALAAVGCVGDPTAPGRGNDDDAWVAFEYDGPLAGRFTAEGAPDRALPALGQTYAYALRYERFDGVEVSAVRRRGAGLADVVDLTIPSPRERSYLVDDFACARWDTSCPGIFVAFDLPTSGSAQEARWSCTVQRGTIRVSRMTSRRVSGTFSGTASCTGRDGEWLDGLRVRDGEFDVPLDDAAW